MKRRQYIYGSAMALGGAAVIGSGSFSTVEAQRETRIEVVGDEDAYLYLEYSDIQFGCNADVTIVTVGNQLKDDITEVDFDLQIDGYGISVNDVSVPEEITLGEAVEITADLECEDAEGTVTASFDIDVSGNGSAVDAHRSERFEIDCECLLDLTGISFIAFCRDDGTPVDVTSLEATRWNGAGEPVEVEWSTENIVDEVILQGGREWYRYSPNGSSGAVRMDEPPAIEMAHADDFDFDGGDNQVKFEGDDSRRCPSSPCDGVVGTKVDESGGELSASAAEETKAACVE